MEQRKWHMQLNEGRESDLPHRLEPVGYCKGVSADKDSNSAVAKTAANTSELKKKVSFAPVNDGVVDLTQPKAVYMAGSLVGAAMGVYKCSNMGLLPTTSADWTWLLPIKQVVETSSFAYSLGQ
ncbi:hypothetical protein BBO99_00003342 [Phytophthora kernoviae]|uniref:ER membrane protein complex subunit 4 n=2 Tax=Phytophthora kernoviae TaxID=325452 RepID=A0A3F2RVG6_9STRA|nr:hypothetical protein G195_003657 [Phytophthora kernoviae 00238/432]KAG2528233.1 hypothetical protein JM16_002969 [Phytophthora kernoviae]KAG2529879.1 hypothetical protein JM18_002656 [Phytophthora kernoviae]RLN21465.1 hypothetical protein BBI17_003400 [Phytophthora kernoviae]RLN64492.1 hypothetical protein BBJ29_001101 [Phytophthora kernoviae]